MRSAGNEKETQKLETDALCLSASVCWSAQSLARFMCKRWLGFGHYYSVYYRVIVIATALSAS